MKGAGEMWKVVIVFFVGFGVAIFSVAMGDFRIAVLGIAVSLLCSMKEWPEGPK